MAMKATAILKILRSMAMLLAGTELMLVAPNAGAGDATQWPVPVTTQGEGAVYATRFIEQISGGAWMLKPLDSGEVAGSAITEAVRSGRFNAGFAWLSADASKIPAADLIASRPFGMEPWEFVGWWFEGGGAALAQDLYSTHGVRPLLCGIAGPEAGGWFRKEIQSVDDFRGLKMRFGRGLPQRILERLGAVAVQLSVEEIVPAFESGRIDAAEFSFPARDARVLGASKLIKNYYFPGWHQSHAVTHLVVNAAVWSGLSEGQRATLESACTASTLRTMARHESIQGEALARFKADGVALRRFPESVLRALQRASDEVMGEQAATDPTFRRILESQRAFRAVNTDWRRLGYFPRDF
jgi:TRAP-type mannitol/chloroaromatic compound transport system substrate-binding protein